MARGWLGLKKGHLSALAMTDIYEYLTIGHDPTTVCVGVCTFGQ